MKIDGWCLSVVMLLAGSALFAQQPENITPSATLSDPSSRRQARAWVRAQRDARYAAQQDSLIASKNYQFLPISVYELPGGSQQMVNNIYYYLALFPDGHLEVHLPTLWGYLNTYVEVLNFDAEQVQDYQANKTQVGWNITFNAQNPEDGTTFRFGIYLTTATGEVIMTMALPGHAMKYVGSLAANEPPKTSTRRNK